MTSYPDVEVLRRSQRFLGALLAIILTKYSCLSMSLAGYPVSPCSANRTPRRAPITSASPNHLAAKCCRSACPNSTDDLRHSQHTQTLLEYINARFLRHLLPTIFPSYHHLHDAFPTFPLFLSSSTTSSTTMAIAPDEDRCDTPLVLAGSDDDDFQRCRRGGAVSGKPSILSLPFLLCISILSTARPAYMASSKPSRRRTIWFC